MESDKIHLLVVSPEKTCFEGMVKYVRLPGSAGLFAVFENHAPLISSLNAGEVVYRSGENKNSIAIQGGFVEVNGNKVSVCITEA
ncbi:MAG: ATP synthase F1 subunit epsilon [Paraprevotella sp.]|nr:ATP synthase F1 subunit epsilon [Paraprevotella sp.]